MVPDCDIIRFLEQLLARWVHTAASHFNPVINSAKSFKRPSHARSVRTGKPISSPSETDPVANLC